MKKIKTHFLLLSLVLVIAFSGCQKNPATTSIPSPAISSVPTNEATPVLSPTSTPSPTPTLSSDAELIEGTKTLYRLPIENFTQDMSNLFFSVENRLYYCFSENGYLKIKELDPYSGKILNSTEFENVNNDYPSISKIIDPKTHKELFYLVFDKVYLYDSDLTLIKTLSLPLLDKISYGLNLDYVCYSNIVLADDLSSYFVDLQTTDYFDNKNIIIRYFEDDTYQVLVDYGDTVRFATLTSVSNNNQIVVQEMNFLSQYTCSVYNYITGEKIYNFPTDCGAKTYNGYTTFNYLDIINYQLFDNKGKISEWILDSKNEGYDYKLIVKDNYFYTSTFVSTPVKNESSDFSLKLYTTEGGGKKYETAFTQQMQETDWYTYSSAYVYTNDGLVGVLQINDIQYLYYWKYKEEVPVEQKVINEEFSLPTVLTPDREAKIQKYKEQLQEKYGITVLYDKSQLNEDVYDVYDILEEENYDIIIESLRVINSTMDTYPEGLIRRLNDRVEGITIFLASGFISNTISVSAFCYCTKEVGLVICFNCETPNTLTSTIYHEFTHAFDDAMSMYSDMEIWASYTKYNPTGHVYDYDYTLYMEGSNSAYTIDNEDDPENVYFYDSYAKCSLYEDRARIIENVLTEGIGSISDYPILMKKLEVIRNQLTLLFPDYEFPEDFLKQTGQQE